MSKPGWKQSLAVSGEHLHSDVLDATTEPSAAAEHQFNRRQRVGRDWPDKSPSVYEPFAALFVAALGESRAIRTKALLGA
jgi:hypothetical protein